MTGLTYYALKFYCNRGLIPGVKRNEIGQRVFDRADVKWVETLACLKKCGMSIKEMQRYVELCLMGDASLPERQEMLRERLTAIAVAMDDLEEARQYVERKLAWYNEAMAGRMVGAE